MAIQYDPRLQGKQNTTDILTGQEGASQAQEQPQSDPNAPAQPSPQSQPQQAPQSNIATKKPSSSGMFTNVAQYVQKNQPATQKMAESASKKFTNTSDIIKKEMGNTLQKYQSNIGSKQQELDTLTQRGRAQVDQIINAPQQMQPSPEQANLATGGTRTASQAQPQPAVNMIEQQQTTTQEPSQQQEQLDFSNIGNLASQIGKDARALNVDAQLNRVEDLRRKAQGINTDQGRKEVLRDVFGQSRKYTQGSQTLDNLLLSGSPQAAQTLAQDVQQAGQSAYDEVTGGARQAQEAFQNLKYDASNIGGELENYRQQAIQGLQSDIDTQRQQFVADRAAEIERERKEAMDAIKALQEGAAGGAFTDLSSFAQALNPMTNRGYVFGSDFEAGAIREILGKKRVNQPFGGPRMKNIYGDVIDYYSDRTKLDADAFDQLADQYKLSDLGINLDDVRNKFYEGSKRAGTNKRSRRFKKSSAQSALDMIRDRISGVNAEDLVRSRLEKQYGGSLDDILAGRDLQEGQYYGMEQDQVDRINRLKQLQKEQDLLQTRDYLDKDEVSAFDAFDRVINKYRK